MTVFSTHIGVPIFFFLGTKNFKLQPEMIQTIQMKLIFLCVWAEPAILGSAKTALEFKYEL
jgi:hypothetical protein